MPTKVFPVALDMKAPTAQRDEWEVVENDSGNVIEITLTDNGTPVDLRNCDVFAVFGLPNGTTVEQDTVSDSGVTIGGDDHNIITIELFTGSFSPGKNGTGLVKCEIQVYSGTVPKILVTSAQFTFRCRRAIMNDGTVESTDAYPILVELISQVAGIARGVQADWAQTDDTEPDFIKNKPNISGSTLDQSVIADEYDSTATYSQYDHCMHDGKLYYCPSAISTPEAWNSDHWTEAKMTEHASTSRYGIVLLSSSTSSSETTLAATPNAVRSAYNLADAAIPKSWRGNTNAEKIATLDSDNKLTPAQGSAKAVDVTSSTLTLGAAHENRKLFVAADCAITIGTIAEDAEIEIWNTGAYTVSIAPPSGGSLFLATKGSKTGCTVDEKGVVGITRHGTMYYVTGDATEASA